MKPRHYAACTRDDAYSALYATLTRYGFLSEIEPLPISIRSRHEQLLMLMDDQDRIANSIKVMIPGYRRYELPWRDPFHAHPLIEYATRHYFVDQLERLSMPASLRFLRNYLIELEVDVSMREQSFVGELQRWMGASGAAARKVKDSTLAKQVRAFAEFCVDREFWGFPEYVICSLPTGTTNKKLYRTAESLFDRRYGPFTQDEVISISDVLNGDADVPIVRRATALLMRDWGLRPIQIALLRESDFGEENGQAFVSVPSVKGTIRSRLRRLSTNMKRRPIAEDTAQHIKAVILRNKVTIPKLKQELERRFPELSPEIADLPAPLFPPDNYQLHMGDFLVDADLREYALHSSAPYLSADMLDLTEELGIPQQIVVGSEISTQVLHISAARFRKTKATLMVLQGYSPDEVAEAMDHSDPTSLRHYFKFNKDVIDYVNTVQSMSPSITGLVHSWVESWKRKEEPSAGTNVRATLNTVLGKCGNPGPCDKHPTVSCYACFKFGPSIHADHAKAAAEIDQYASTIGGNSTGPVREQLMLASANAHKLADEQAKMRKESANEEDNDE